MATTIKAVRRNKGNCICNNRPEWVKELAGVCRYGCCKEFRCPVCRGKLGGWGSVECKCEGGPRWLRHPGMATPGRYDLARDKFVEVHVAVKPSLLRRGLHRNP
jgi:hypothetical protein